MKDVARAENVKRYVHVPKPSQNQVTNMLSQQLPMVAMFLRSKPLAWGCLLIAFQSMLNEPLIRDPADESQPGIFKILFAVVGVVVSYIDIIFPNAPPAGV